jgi:Tfp pilus assembly protein PilO
MAFNWQTEYHRYRHYIVNLDQFYRQKKGRAYTEIVLSLLTVTFFLFFAIKPTLVTITGLTKEIEDQKLVNQKLAEKIDSLNQAQKIYSTLEPDLYLVGQALPKDANLSTFVKELEAMMRLSGVAVKAIQFNQVGLKNGPPTPGEKESPSGVNFSLAATGNYASLKNFLHSLFSLRRLVSVENFSFGYDKKETETLILSLDAQAHFLEADK